MGASLRGLGPFAVAQGFHRTASRSSASAALVLSGCRRRPTVAMSTPVESLALKIGTALPQTGNLAFLGPPEEAGVAYALSQINEATADTGLDARGRLRRLGRHRQQGLRDRDPPPPRRGRLRHHRCCVVGYVAAVHRPGRRRRRHPVLAGQHLGRLHARTTTTDCTSVPPRRTCSRVRCSAT